ncbi:MAG: TlyA family RNA methyltransferase [Desulfobacterales bacterium]|nr:TlyA family RNA methyltransferase [Desulfobacterales bacterium]MDD4072217.1 TlyA family RNA methyltransferase [Desulfobacterales bacterium]MDD4393056.1 TlyA family RNA methyltransferase [Desulfobacterales bacterium]
MSSVKIRLDLAVVQKGLASSRQRAQALIMAGKILVNNQPVDKPGTRILTEDELLLKGEQIAYVSRGGLKLEAAVKSFALDLAGLVCLDVGASTGGFTDCLLQHGADRVYAVDVGYGQLAWKLRQDSRVIVIERTNIRYMPPETLPEPVDLVTIDASFISLKIVIPAVLKFLKSDARILALIKPQFEVGKGKVGKGGVVRDPLLHDEVLRDLTVFFSDMGLLKESAICSPVLGPKGNREFLMSLKYLGS